MTCHRCQTEAFKFGFANGYQRYRCKTCNKTFSDIPEKPLDSLRVDPRTAFKVVQLLCEGVGIRACERLTGLNRRTVLNILETAARKCEALMNERVKGIKPKEIQIDETYAFVYCLQASTTVDDTERGDQYTFLALEKTTKFILHYHVAKRDGDSTMEFMRGLRKRVEGRFQLTSDSYAPYCGDLSAVFRVFRETIDYGTEQKHFSTGQAHVSGRINRRNHPKTCQWVKRTPRIGNPDRENMTTNHVERQNLSVRLFNRRFTRKTMGFSKTLRNHKFSVALMVGYNNWCRVHSTLGTTPAVAQGLTDHTWSVEELLSWSIEI